MFLKILEDPPSRTLFILSANTLKNIESEFSTFPCLTSAAEKSIEKWSHAQRLIDGRSYPRKQVHTEVSFQVVDNLTETTRRNISNAFISVGIALDRKLDPRIALEKIAALEKRYDGQLTESERATLLRYRGAAKIDALEYQSALEDLHAALAFEKDKTTAKGIENVISQLEAALGIPDTPEP